VSDLKPKDPSGRGSHSFTFGWIANPGNEIPANGTRLLIQSLDRRELVVLGIPSPHQGAKITCISAQVTLVGDPTKETT
jgi:hypothetical protein